MKKLNDNIPSMRQKKPISSNKLIGINEISYLSVGCILVPCSEFNHRINAEYRS